MLTRNEQAIAAIHRLKLSADFNTVIEWLTQSLDTQDRDNRFNTDPVLLHQGQGKAQLLAELLTTIEDSTDIINRTR